MLLFEDLCVIDFDKITLHFVECIYINSYNTKLMKQQAGSSNTSNQAHMPTSGINTQSYQTAPPNQVNLLNSFLQFTGQYVVDRLNVVDKMLFACFTTRKSGIDIEEVVIKLVVSLDKIRESIDDMVIEGLIYSSIDENHFKSTGNA
uniref:Replication protein A C-terminal domain-containing protein n=1 Tax=Lactuca sativa TaxID=4236 RepID=A0A9R1VMB7_LACSA|nr:hypothetical protein LSAT_V11C400202050 [Lactuca sativa]